MASRAWMICASTAIEGYKATVSLFQYFSLYTNLYTHIFDSLIPRCDIFKIRGNILMSRTVGSDYSSYTMYICLYGDEATWDFEMCGFVRNPGYNFQVATLRLHNLSADTEGSSGSWLRTEYHQQARAIRRRSWAFTLLKIETLGVQCDNGFWNPWNNRFVGKCLSSGRYVPIVWAIRAHRAGNICPPSGHKI